MRAGKLRNRIDIGSFSNVPDGYGGSVATWSTDRTVWGSIKGISGSRGQDAQQIIIEQLYEIRLRYDDYPMLNKKNKLGYNNKTFVIHSIIDVMERYREFVIKCYVDDANDLYLYNENLEFITDENGDKISVNN